MKKVLIVTKSTNREIHGERIHSAFKKGVLTDKDINEINLEHDQHYATLNELTRVLDQYEIEYILHRREHAWPQDDFDLVFSVGGDGTLLHVSSKLKHSQKVIAIRSSSKSVGFLCQIMKDQVHDAIKSIINDQAEFKLINRISAQIIRINQQSVVEMTAPVLNEFLFASPHPASTARYKIVHGSNSEFHKSSGVWVATAAGSSAAIAASGGKVFPLEDKACQFKVRELYQHINAPSIITGGEFTPNDEDLTIENRSIKAILSADGSSNDVELSYGDRVKFGVAEPLLMYSYN